MGGWIMGSPDTEPGRIPNETKRQVTFAKGLRIGVTEVTQKEWRLIMGTHSSSFKGDDLPVERITWREADERAMTGPRVSPSGRLAHHSETLPCTQGRQFLPHSRQVPQLHFPVAGAGDQRLAVQTEGQ